MYFVFCIFQHGATFAKLKSTLQLCKNSPSRIYPTNHKPPVMISQLKTLGVLTLLIAQTAFTQTKEYATIGLPAGLTGTPTSIMSDPGIARLLTEGKNILPALSKHFADTSVTAVFSACAGRFLKQGEIALLVADRIESMPYFLLTGLQNCTLESCDGKTLTIEWYLDFIRQRNMTGEFSKRYNKWLISPERKKNNS